MINNNELKEQILQISGVNARKCMRCGKCTATCPSFDNMEYHPHQFVYMVESGNIEPLLNSKSLYTCLSCFACVERCPRGVEPAKSSRQQGLQLSASRVQTTLNRRIYPKFLMTICRSRLSSVRLENIQSKEENGECKELAYLYVGAVATLQVPWMFTRLPKP